VPPLLALVQVLVLVLLRLRTQHHLILEHAPCCCP
jgi:hypothetical protein